MFFDRLFQTPPLKEALITKGETLSYKELLENVKKRAAYFHNHRADYLLAHTSEVENLINFLALLYTGQKAVFAGKNTTNELKITYAEKYGLKILDFSPNTAEPAEIDPFTPKAGDYFLGVLTSGSTGTSKIIWKDYQSWFSAFQAQSDVFKLTSADRILVLDALGYSANLNTVIHALWLGATAVLTSLQHAKEWPEIIKKRNVSSIFMVPSHYRLFPEELKISGVKTLVSAGEKLSPDLAQNLLKIFDKPHLTEYYGAAELGHISYIQNQEIIKNPTSVGKAFPGVNIHIKDEKIWVQSPYVSPEYRQKATVLDVGFLDADGYLTLLGRQGRMFNRRGLNIFAEEIENAALLHPCISEAVLIQSKKSSDQLNLLLVKEKPVSQTDLRQFLLKSISKEKLPNKILFTENIPRNDAGKIDLKAIVKKPVEEDNYIIL